LGSKFFLLLYFTIVAPILLWAQKPDSVPLVKDSLQNPVAPVTINRYAQATDSILSHNQFLNSYGTPVSMAIKPKKAKSADGVFYLIACLVLLLAFIRFFFANYFTNLFRVFFNTSLRQSQLTDQLLQAKLPSLLFNVLFIFSAGVYAYFLLLQYGLINNYQQWILLGACIIILALVYLVKYSTLKFTGWVTGYQAATDTYIFIIFLICKIIGVLLIPFIALMAFAAVPVANTSALISLLVIVLLLILRFLRSYGLIQNQLKISRFHFFLYITGVEIIPLLLLYKGVLILLTKSL
jgi:hypothetical protein